MKKTKNLSKRRTGLFGLKSIGICGIILLAFVLTLGACSDTFSPPDTKPTVSNNSISLTRTEQLALLKTQDNHKVSVDALQVLVEKALATPGGRSVASAGSSITGVKKLSLDKKYFTSSGSARSALGVAEEEPVEVYEFAVGNADNENEGFVLASNDVRIGTILAIAEGSLEDANEDFVGVLQSGLQDYIDSVILEYNSITEAEIEVAVEKADNGEAKEARGTGTISGDPSYGQNIYMIGSDLTIVKAPLLMTNWGQGTLGTYTGYVYNNYVMYVHGNMQHKTGCAPTAIAQIIAYHNYISPLSSVPLPAAFTNHPQLGTWSGSFNLPTIRAMETITSTSTAAARGQVAVLMWYIGHPDIGNATYNDGLTTAEIYKARLGFERLGYVIANYDTSATSVTGTSNFTITYNTTLATIKSALNNNRPIYFRGADDITGGTHAWVIDGHGTMTRYSELYINNGRETRYITLSDDNLMVHCNLGWNGTANGWYIYGIFDTGKQLLLENGALKVTGQNYSGPSTGLIIPRKP